MPRYQTSWRRFWAAMVDGIVFVPFSFLDDWLLVPGQSPSVLVIWATLSYSSYWLYSVVLHARFGQTVGKRLLRVKVLDVHEQQIPTFLQALLRDIGLVVLNTSSLAFLVYLVCAGTYAPGSENTGLPGQILTWAGISWLVLELLTMLTNEKSRALHDFIAGTVVVCDA
jgi:uncharacterized RDD family membrane protein YckC